jgi:hypothetical protein
MGEANSPGAPDRKRFLALAFHIGSTACVHVSGCRMTPPPAPVPEPSRNQFADNRPSVLDGRLNFGNE